ncbi:MAG: beta-N-acetylhexosaminidase, partial [Chryseobacterium gambrini]|nr:beta-N-acetylhexosaminidase [Chryseobacterium gambrini]
MQRFLLVLSVLFSSLFFTQTRLNLIPYPQKVELKTGNFEISGNTLFVGDKKSNEYKYFMDNFKKIYPKNSSENIKKAKPNFISLLLNKDLKIDNKREFNSNYIINISNEMMMVIGKNPEGLFQGIQTLLQLIKTSEDGKIPALEIQDSPKFQWRGMHLDVSRHFFTVEEVKQYIDYLAMYKLNTFHWHLTDDQGWRIEIKKYPKLTQIGSKRKESMIGAYVDNTFDGKPYGPYFYTQDQIKEVVKYAQERHITIVPEIEMPGHALAALSAYPDLACTKGPFEPATKWGVFDDVFCPKEETFKFLENVLDEVIVLFPSQYIHIGGDECPKTRWKECAHCQELIKKNNLKDEHGLQSYFIQRIEKYVNSKGRKIIGWDEILEGGLAPNAAVMSWTGIKGGVEAAKSGHFAVMTPGSYCYFDH